MKHNNPTDKERREAWVAFVTGALAPSTTPMIDADRLLKEYDKRFTRDACTKCYGNGVVWMNHAGGGGGYHICDLCKGTSVKEKK